MKANKKTYVQKSSVDNFTAIVEKSRLCINLIQQFFILWNVVYKIGTSTIEKSRNESRSVLFYTLLCPFLTLCVQPAHRFDDYLWWTLTRLFMIDFPFLFLRVFSRFKNTF